MSGPEGFDAFVAGRYAALVRTGWLLTGDPGRAEDLVQEALVRCWRAWSSIQRKDRPEVYVRQIMVHLNTSWWRRRWRGETPSELSPDLVAVEDATASVDRRDGVYRALAVLPPHQRAVVVLRFFDDLSVADTAAVMGCSVGAVKSQTSRALARLRTVPELAGLIDAPEPTHRSAPERRLADRTGVGGMA